MRKVLGDQGIPTSCRHLVGKRRVIITAAGLVDTPRHRPRAKAIISSRSKQFGPSGAIQSGIDIRPFE